MADINNNDIWIDVETLAKLKNITRRAVRLALNQNKYEYKVENIRLILPLKAGSRIERK